MRIGRVREGACPHRGSQMVDMLVLYSREERLRYSKKIGEESQ